MKEKKVMPKNVYRSILPICFCMYKMSKKKRKREIKGNGSIYMVCSLIILLEDILLDKCEQINKKISDSSWNFDVDYNDHFETPKVAYLDIFPILEEVSKRLNKPLSQLVVYDPYYCQGQVVTLLNEIGIRNVINKNADFYNDISTNNIPSEFILYECKI